MIYNIEEKLETYVNTLRSWSTVKYIFPLEVSYIKDDGATKLKDIKNKEFVKFDKPFIISDANTYFWFKTSFEINKENRYQNGYLCIESFINNVASTIRPQGELYLNDELVAGIDINHTDIKLKDGKYEMYLRFYTHIFNFSFPLYFSIKYKDDRILDLYYDLFTIFDSWKNLKKDDPNYLIQQDVINNVINLIDFRQAYSADFYSSINKAKKYLKEEYFNKLCGKSEYEIAAVAHSHIDMAWLWPVSQTRDKSQRTFSTVLKFMEEYPNYRYMHTSPQLFKYLKEDNPILYEKIKEKVKENRFELEGAMWVEADNNLTAGESLVRQILYGQQFFQKEFGITCKTVIEPDVFGYSGQLPQILKKSNIERFVTAKIGWNDTNRFPYDSFQWEAIDGSKVFTYLISTCDSDVRSGIYDHTYTDYVGKMNASQIVGCVNRYQQKDLNKTFLMTFGYGDGGGGPTRDMIEMQKRFEYGLPGLAKVKLYSLNEALDKIESQFRRNCFLKDFTPSWKGELYFEYHRGTYTSVPRVKRNNRYGENLLSTSEIFDSILSNLNLKNYPYDDIKSHYELLLFNQFHDVLPGSGVKEIYQDSDKDFAKIFNFTDKDISNSVDILAKNISSQGGLLVFNPNSFATNDYIIYNHKCYEVMNCPSLGYEVIKLENRPSLVSISNKKLSNQFFDIIFNDKGEIISLYDKRLSKEFVDKNNPFNRLISYEDMPYQYDNWELAPYYYQKHYEITSKAEFIPLDEGDRKGFELIRKYADSEIRQKIYLYNNLDKIEFVNDVSWKEKRQVLKVHFPINMNITEANYDIQFGNVSRNTKITNSYDEAKFEVYAQKWVDVSDSKYGLGLINDSKYGFSLKDNNLALTIVKSGSFPYEEASDIIPTFTFCLYPHRGNYASSDVIEEAYKLNKKLVFKEIKPSFSGVLSDYNSFINISNKGCYLETIKQSEDHQGLILRMYEGHKETKKINMKINMKFNKCYKVDLMENIISELEINNNSVEFEIKPFEIVSLKLM